MSTMGGTISTRKGRSFSYPHLSTYSRCLGVQWEQWQQWLRFADWWWGALVDLTPERWISLFQLVPFILAAALFDLTAPRRECHIWKSLSKYCGLLWGVPPGRLCVDVDDSSIHTYVCGVGWGRCLVSMSWRPHPSSDVVTLVTSLWVVCLWWCQSLRHYLRGCISPFTPVSTSVSLYPEFPWPTLTEGAWGRVCLLDTPHVLIYSH